MKNEKNERKEKTRFVKKTALIAIALFSIVFVLNQIYITQIDNNRLIFRKEAEWQEYKPTLDGHLPIAIMGDSHARNDLNPKYIDGSYNFATSGEDYVETYYKLRKLLELDRIPIDTLVLEVDMHSFSDKLRTDKRLFGKIRHYASFISLKEISKLKGKDMMSLYFAVHYPMIGKGEDFIYLSMNDEDYSLLYRGWVNDTRNYSESDKEHLAQGKYKMQFNDTPSLYNNRSLEYFGKLIRIAEKKGIEVVFIAYPISKTYYEELTAHGIDRDEYYSKLSKYTAGHRLLDHYDIYFDKPEYFADPNHLNELGSTEFSKLVERELNQKESP